MMKFENLPTLEGTEKQVAWAIKLRAKYITYFEEHIGRAMEYIKNEEEGKEVTQEQYDFVNHFIHEIWERNKKCLPHYESVIKTSKDPFRDKRMNKAIKFFKTTEEKEETDPTYAIKIAYKNIVYIINTETRATFYIDRKNTLSIEHLLVTEATFYIDRKRNIKY